MAPMVLVVGAVLFFAGIAAAFYFWRKEKRLEEQLQGMLDDAIAGRVLGGRLDESPVAAIGSRMWRFLCGQELAEQRLREEQEQLQTYLSDISHQAVLAVSNLMLYTQLAEEWLEQPDDRSVLEQELSAIREQAGALDFFIEALVKLSRLETGMIHVSPRKQPLQPLFNKVLIQFQEKAGQKDIRLSADPTEEEAVFDLKWTVEAVSNLVDNAIKYTQEGGNVRISVQTYPSLVAVDITDNGMGITPQEQAAVFRRFYRAKAAGNEPGVGIGLYLAREVMKAQNGYIKLASREGEGSCFSLFFLKWEKDAAENVSKL